MHPVVGGDFALNGRASGPVRCILYRMSIHAGSPLPTLKAGPIKVAHDISPVGFVLNTDGQSTNSPIPVVLYHTYEGSFSLRLWDTNSEIAFGNINDPSGQIVGPCVRRCCGAIKGSSPSRISSNWQLFSVTLATHLFLKAACSHVTCGFSFFTHNTIYCTVTCHIDV